jgi:hypothetical protein
MKIKTFTFRIITGAVLALATGRSLVARSPAEISSAAVLAKQAVSEDTNISSVAIKALRAEGPAGLQTLLETYAGVIRNRETNLWGSTSTADLAAWNRLRAALDSVSGQRDCQASHLFWYTDMEQAKAAANATGKPILSLRLLGRLDEEYSCANSRFFRTTLYANTEVSQYLRDHFILHWKSVRPVPRITIDFGDGRKIERTVTGNSIHYILSPDGEPVDALPGLYGPKAFLKGLAEGQQAALKYAALDSSVKIAWLRQYHNERYNAVYAAWNDDLAKVGNVATVAKPAPTGQSVMATPTALTAGRVAMTKSGVEIVMLRSFQDADDATWTKITALHQDDAALDSGAQELIRSKNPNAFDAGRLTTSKSLVENPFVATLKNLERSIAEDTVRNEYQLHSKIHEWFMRDMVPASLDQFNSRVYTELFLTPDSDPWLGLVPANTFTGLDNNGLMIQPEPKR